MHAYLTKLMQNRKGFTLIELMVVVVILGVLAGAAIMSLGGSQSDQAKRARVEADIATIQSAVEFYKLDVGSYPTSIDALVTKPASGADGWNGPYLRNVPEHPLKKEKNGKYEIDGNGKVTASPAPEEIYNPTSGSGS